ncbi:DPH4 homolog [Eupeodes corollae]|uniref:DPH4 homolog n=1 Tax=Eupeodes corollae TaxID=290404 RepID=UPI00248F81BF|nr:DPH4 homolog [Eupeodes corollae]
MSTTANFYEILQCSESATLEELKHKYKQLILQYHPDKMNDLSDSLPSSSSVSENNYDDACSFHQINTAWNTLKDPTKRKLYDAELCQNRFQLHNNVFDRLRIEDLDTETYIDDDDDGTERTIRTWRCRCGGQYIFEDEAEAEISTYNNTDELLIECTECSLVIVLRR